MTDVVFVAVAICAIFTAAGLLDKAIGAFAGLCWVAMGLAVFSEYGDMFIVLSVGAGMFLLARGVIDYIPE